MSSKLELKENKTCGRFESQIVTERFGNSLSAKYFEDYTEEKIGVNSMRV